MDLQPTLDALHVDSLADLTLEELKDTTQAAGLSKYLTLQIFLGWLNEHIKKDIRQDLGRFVPLLLEQFSESEIKAVFDKWQKKDAEEDPTNRRRYMIIKEDIFRILEHISRASNIEADLPSRPSHPFLPPPGDTDESIEDPVGLSLSDIHQMKKNSKNNNKHNRDRDLKRELEEHIALIERESNPTLRSIIWKENRKPNFSYRTSPYSSYVCKRCHKRGHWLGNCPTNLDPAFDQAPEPDYVCEICQAVGKHFKTLCSRNREPDSWTQKRLQAGARPISPIRYDSVSYLDRSSSPPHRGSPTAPSHRSDNSTVSSQWDHKQLPRRTKSDKYHRTDVGSRYRPKKPQNYSSSPLYTIREQTNHRAEEGRLAYDNDVYGSPCQQGFDSLASSPAAVIDERGNEDEVVKCVSPIVEDTPEDMLDDIERAKRDTDEFLGNLANELSPGKYSSEKVALLDICSKTIVRKKTERMKAANLMD